MSEHEILPGNLPTSFLYPAQAIFDSGGKVEIHIDAGEELQVDFSSPRMLEAMRLAKELGKEYSQPRTQTDIFEIIEGVGDIVFRLFGPYNRDYMEKFREHRGASIPEEEKQKQLYQIVYGEDSGEVLELSDIETGDLICSEFATVGAVLCHTAGLKTYMMRSPAVIFRVAGYDASAQSVGGGGGHSSIVIVDDCDRILSTAEFSSHRRYSWGRHLWQNTMKNLSPMTIAELREGTPLVAVNALYMFVYFMGDPLQFGPEDYFQHSQYEGIDTNLRKEPAYRLYDHCREQIVSIFNQQPFCAILRFFKANTPTHRQELFLDLAEDELERVQLQGEFDWIQSILDSHNNSVFVWLDWRRSCFFDRFMQRFG